MDGQMDIPNRTGLRGAEAAALPAPLELLPVPGVGAGRSLWLGSTLDMNAM